ncbi:MAG: alpha-L-rhamnosidase, partial [Planctomycetes bacterium]|nr:alpha-L-rhamnosidase [Planctomycetota bacterium]
YPANANWRLWALAKAGRVDVVLDEFRGRWHRMSSVRGNNTIQEDWVARPDTVDQWSHCAVSPVYVTFMDVAGIRPLAPGFARCAVRPQLGDLPGLEVAAHTVRGTIGLKAEAVKGGHSVRVTVPEDIEAELRLPAGAGVPFERTGDIPALGLETYRLVSGRDNQFVLKS